MFGSLYAFLLITVFGSVAGFFLTPKRVGIVAIAFLPLALVAMVIGGLIGLKDEYGWYLGIAAMMSPIYAALAFGGAQIGRIARDIYDTRRKSKIAR